MKHLTQSDLKQALTAIGELTIKAKEAPQAAAILARFESEIADFGKPAAEPVKEPQAATPKTDLVPAQKATNGEGHVEQ